MSLFTDFEKTIERGFRRWTERVFGAAQSDELLMVHRAILEEIESKVQTAARGKKIFPYSTLVITLASPDAERRAVYQAAFGDEGRLAADIRKLLEGAGCELPRGVAVQVRTAETGEKPFTIEYGIAAPEAEPAKVKQEPPPPAVGRVIVVRGKAEQQEYTLERPRTNIGRMQEITDAEERVLRRNDIVFEEAADPANATVSRKHAHIRLDDGEYRVCDDESEFGTRVFRGGRPIEVPPGNRRGERLRPGDEIYFGRACLRFER
jgi:hypothetical protein